MSLTLLKSSRSNTASAQLSLVVAGCHHLADYLVEIGAVGQSGQIVEPRHRADLLLRIDAQSDVLEDDDAEAACPFAGREFEVPAVGQADQDLAVAPFAQRAGQLRFEVAPVLAAEQAARHAAHDQRLQRSAEQRIGRFRRQAPRSPRRWRPPRVRPGRASPGRATWCSARGRSAARCCVDFFSSMMAVNSTVRTCVGHPVMMKMNGTTKQAEDHVAEVALQNQTERDRRNDRHATGSATMRGEP